MPPPARPFPSVRTSFSRGGKKTPIGGGAFKETDRFSPQGCHLCEKYVDPSIALQKVNILYTVGVEVSLREGGGHFPFPFMTRGQAGISVTDHRLLPTTSLTAPLSERRLAWPFKPPTPQMKRKEGRKRMQQQDDKYVRRGKAKYLAKPSS